MKKNTQEIFFELLKAGLWERDVELRNCGSTDFSEILRLAEEQSVVGLVAAGIERFQVSGSKFQVPQEWALQFIGHLGRSGWYAAGAAVCEMVEAVICDQRRVFPVCAYLNGEYGYQDIYLGVPVILGKNGVEKVIELELDEDDRVRFNESHDEVKSTLELLNNLK